MRLGYLLIAACLIGCMKEKDGPSSSATTQRENAVSTLECFDLTSSEADRLKAAASTDGEAAYRLFLYHQVHADSGRAGWEQHATEASHWLLRGAELGYGVAQYSVAFDYVYGQTFDLDKAEQWLKKVEGNPGITTDTELLHNAHRLQLTIEEKKHKK